MPGRSRVLVCAKCGNRPEPYADVAKWCRICNAPCATVKVKAAKRNGGKARKGAKRMVR